MKSFVARTIVVEELADTNTFLVGLADNETGDREHLVLQRALSFSDQDRRMGMATYCAVTSSGTAYGGIVSCVLDRDALEIELSLDVARKLGVRGFDIVLDTDEASIQRLREGLRRIFPEDDRPARFEV